MEGRAVQGCVPYDGAADRRTLKYARCDVGAGIVRQRNCHAFFQDRQTETKSADRFSRIDGIFGNGRSRWRGGRRCLKDELVPWAGCSSRGDRRTPIRRESHVLRVFPRKHEMDVLKFPAWIGVLQIEFVAAQRRGRTGLRDGTVLGSGR